MNSISQLVKAGFDLKGHPTHFVGLLERRRAQHYGRNVENKRLRKSAETKQTPDYAFFGETLISATSIFRTTPGQAFNLNCPSGIVLPPQASEQFPVLSRSTHAAVIYAAAELGVKEVRVLSSNASMILPHIVGTKKHTGAFMKMWAPYWAPVIAKLKQKPKYKKASIQEKYRLAAIELVQTNASYIEEMLRQYAKDTGKEYDFNVIPYYFDANKKQLNTYDRGTPQDKYKKTHTERDISIVPSCNLPPKNFGCSCCDSRGLLTHIFCTRPGEFNELHTIASIVPNHENVLSRGVPNSAWLQIEMAKAQKCANYTLTGHTRCGGIAALVEWSLTGQPPGNPVLAKYLEQAKPVVDEVIKFAELNGFIDDKEKIRRLAEMHVTRWSATNVKRYINGQGQVIANYLDIVTREIYPLPLMKKGVSPSQGIEDTYKLLEQYEEKKLMTLTIFYNTLVQKDRTRLQACLKNPTRFKKSRFRCEAA